ncbi:MAG: pentapeptide repeat-containing protein [Nitrospinae bacterium]|nr:pentapeptide repeat-containing protein [Nitrospinota bacterium]
MAKLEITPQSERQGTLKGSAVVAYILGIFSLTIFISLNSLGHDFRFETILATIVAAYPLYTVWRFRNEDKQQDIENARADNLQKDFHQIQKWATKSEDGISDSLQIAAIHQLKPYLVGDLGPSFRRPAYEIFRALLDDQMKPRRAEYGLMTRESLEMFRERAPQPHIKAIHTVLREILKNDGALFNVFPEDTMPLGELNLCCANLAHTKLQSASLIGANLVGTNLLNASLERARLLEAHLECAQLNKADLNGALLNSSHLENADLGWAKLQGAEMVNTFLMGADLVGSEFDEHTRFGGTVYSKDVEVMLDTRWDQHIDPPADSRFIHIDDWKKQEERFKRNASS